MMTDTPVTPDPMASVVDIGEIRVARGQTYRPVSRCEHKNMVVDRLERRIWCKDCEHDVDPFDAFVGIVRNLDRAVKNHQSRAEKLREAEEKAVISRAAKALDNEWRKHKTVPCCPHCKEALLPEDFALNRIPTASKELAIRKRKAKEKQ